MHKTVSLAMLTIGITGFLLIAPEQSVSARAAGQIVLTKTEPPTKATRVQMKQFLSKNRIRTLSAGADGYRFYVMAKLRKPVLPKWMSLPSNNGKLTFALYRRVKGQWKVVYSKKVDYPAKAKVVEFPCEIPDASSLPRNNRYDLRLTVQTPKSHPQVLSRGTLMVK